MAADVFGIQKTFDISSRRIRRVQLGKWGSDEEQIFQACFFLQIYFNSLEFGQLVKIQKNRFLAAFFYLLILQIEISGSFGLI